MVLVTDLRGIMVRLGIQPKLRPNFGVYALESPLIDANTEEYAGWEKPSYQEKIS